MIAFLSSAERNTRRWCPAADPNYTESFRPPTKVLAPLLLGYVGRKKLVRLVLLCGAEVGRVRLLQLYNEFRRQLLFAAGALRLACVPGAYSAALLLVLEWRWSWQNC